VRDVHDVHDELYELSERFFVGESGAALWSLPLPALCPGVGWERPFGRGDDGARIPLNPRRGR